MPNRSVRLSLLLCVLPGLLRAQATVVPFAAGDTLPRPPADRVEDLVRWSAGGSVDIDGLPTWRGRALAGAERTVDGILWGNIVRSDRYSSNSWLRAFAPSLNALAGAEVRAGGYAPQLGGGGPGSLAFQTRSGTERWEIGGSAATGGALDPGRIDGLTRLDASVGGPLLPGWRVRATGTVLGRPMAGLREGNERYYLPAGIDTTYRYQVTPGDTVDGVVQRFEATDGVPRSPLTTADLMARVDGRVGPAQVWVRALRGTEAERYFASAHVANSAQSFGRNGRQHDIAAGGSLPLVGGWTVAAHLAWQEERLEEGPIAPSSELDSRDPAFGILASGLDMRFGFDEFPVDEELEWNYRRNTPGSRRSPYDLENTGQYLLIDDARNNPYGVRGYSEAGGPIGRVRLYQDRRMEVGVSASAPAGEGVVTLGATHRAHTIVNYSHDLTSQAFSDVWRVSPIEQALFAEWRVAGASWWVSAGARLDRFDTKARRPRVIPRYGSLGTYVDPGTGDTLRWEEGSLDRQTWYELNTDPDKAHTALSLRASASGTIAPDVQAHLAVGRHARTPDLGLQLTGINTDLSNTNSSRAFGTDYGHDVVDAMEAGIRTTAGALELEVTGFREKDVWTPVARLDAFFDPLTMSLRDLIVIKQEEGTTRMGVTAAAAYRVAPTVTLRGAYTYVSIDDEDGGPTIETEPRPHTLSLSAEGRTPGSGPLGNATLVVALQQSTGIARMIDDGVFPFPTSDLRSSSIPAWRTLDARLVKQFTAGGRDIRLYVDARNILNATNLIRAFDTGDPDRSVAAEEAWIANDVSAFRNEGEANGNYTGGSIDLTFGGAGRAGCGSWVEQSGAPRPQNCAYLIAAEERFGNGNGIFTLAEQERASRAEFLAEWGPASFRGAARTVRVGAALSF
jgi:hypothetical protein